jgi:hypothetical protein
VSVNAEKLYAIVTLLSEVRLMLDGGWHFSSPIIRLRAAEAPTGDENLDPCGVIIERPDALSMVAELVADLDRTATAIMCLDQQASELEVDTKVMCGADLGLLSRVYQQLAQDVSRAANTAVDALKPPPTTKPERKRRSPTTSSSSAQTSLLNTKPGMQSGESYDTEPRAESES